MDATMEFLVGIDATIPDGTPESEVKERVSAEAIAAAGLARQGHLVRRWKPPVAPGQSKAVGLYRADSYTLQTDGGDVLYVQSRGVRHGSAEVLAQIETAAAELDWLNKGVFVSVGGRQPSGVVHETYLVQ
jgi:muconolactone delta-isomerase